MAKTRALIIGVSRYFLPGAIDLPLCRNDIIAVESSFINGLNVKSEDIVVCGKTGTVTFDDVVTELKRLTDASEQEDTILFYFSGHGMTCDSRHYLVLSDCLIDTQSIIEYFENNASKSKVIFLDCCYAGSISVEVSPVFDINETVNEFAGKGYAVFASCSSEQVSGFHPLRNLSVFTCFLCDALSSRLTIREGKKSLNDIHSWLFMLLRNWNKMNPNRIQSPIYKANLGGTIYFNVEDYRPFLHGTFYEENDEIYIIYAIEPLHNGIAKRYCVKVILKTPMPYDEIAEINKEIVQKVKFLNIYSNPQQEKRWAGKPTNLIFCYYGFDETDLVNGNYLCNTTWCDDSQDREYWYKTGKYKEMISGVHFHHSPYYQQLKSFVEEHIGTTEELVQKTKEIISRMVTLAEQVIFWFNEYLNESITESEFKNNISDISKELSKLYLEENNLDIPPDGISDWCQLNSNLAATIHDFTLFYGNNTFVSRTPSNRKDCMNIAIERYYKELEALKQAENLLI